MPVGAADALRGGPYHSDLYIVEKNGKYGAYHKGKLIIPVIHSRYEGVNDNYNPQKIFSSRAIEIIRVRLTIYTLFRVV